MTLLKNGNIPSEVARLQAEMNSENKYFSLSIEEAKKPLKKALVMLGVKREVLAQISEVEKEMMIAFIKKHYGNFTANQIYEAFELAIVGKLDLDVKEVESYNKFDCPYIGKILASYKRYISKIFEDNRHILDVQPVQALPPSLMSEDEIIADCFERFKSMKNKMLALDVRVFYLLKNRGDIKLSPEETATYFARAKDIVAAKGVTDPYYRQVVKDENAIMQWAEKLALGDYFTKKIEHENIHGNN